MELNTIHCGECSEVMKQLPDNSIDLTVTSPPYDNLRDYKGYTFPFESIAQQLWRVTKQGGVVVWVVGDATIDGSETLTSFRQALYFRELGFWLHDTMIFAKNGLSYPFPNRYHQSFEYMFLFSKESPKTINLLKDRRNKSAGDGRKFRHRREADGKVYKSKEEWTIGVMGYRSNIWEYDIGNLKATKDKFVFNHPAIFPEALARDHIISWSNPGDIVLDPMCGSGTTLKMAKEQGRQYIGIDISQEYVDLSQKRVEGARVPLPMINETPTQDRKQLGFT